MDILWNPWRYDYIKSGEQKSNTANSGGCVFCDILKNPATDEEKFILHRAGFNFVILNIFPYVSGHLMIVPYAHLADLDKADKPTTDEMMDLAKQCQTRDPRSLRAERDESRNEFRQSGRRGRCRTFSSAYLAALDRRRKFYDFNRRNAHHSRRFADDLRKIEREVLICFEL